MIETLEITLAKTTKAEVIVTGGAIVVPGMEIEHHPALVYLASLSQSSRKPQGIALNQIAKILSAGQHNSLSYPWASLNYLQIMALISHLKEVYAPATANRMLNALKGVLKQSWKMGQIPQEDYSRLIDFKPIKGTTLLKGRALTKEDFHKLLAECDSNAPGDVQDRAIIAVLYSCGLRRVEAVALKLEDYTPKERKITVLHGKGNKARTTYLSTPLQLVLDQWLAVRGDRPGTIFCPVFKDGRIIARPLSTDALYQKIRRLAVLAGLPPITPHDFRRTMISDLFSAGTDIVTVQNLAGHSSPTVTSKYDRRGEQSKAAAVEHLSY